MQPGQSFSPGSSSDTPSWQYNSGTDQQPPAEPDTQPAAPPPPDPVVPQAAPTPQNGVTWSASEFIAHQKPAGWYAMLALAAIVLAAGIYFITRDKLSTGVIIFVAIIFGIAGARQPKEQQYKIDEKGVTIGDKNYLYNAFRSFSIVQEEGVESIWFIPLKRFRPPISIYFDPNDGDRIVDILSQFLPVENHQLDAVDRLMHRLRF